MEADHFDRSLRAFVRRRPFEPFVIRFVDGLSITVDHPEAVMTRAGVAIYCDPDGQPMLFDHRSVSVLTSANQAAPA